MISRLSTSIAFPFPPPTSIYIHLPFCLQKCAYCAFPVIVTPNVSPTRPPPLHTNYVQLLTTEISSFFTLYTPPPLPIQTLYLGGGTPSLLHPHLLHRIISTLSRYLTFSPNLEFTCEMDPATFTSDTAAKFASAGVNRASVGAQTFDSNLLKLTRRIHTPSDIGHAISALRTAGIPNISLDLIAGLPHQTSETWQNSLEKALQLRPEHLSVYDLTLEQNTPFHTAYKPGTHPLPSEDLSVRMLTEAVRILTEAGYQHYEVSSFAKTNPTRSFRSRHNLAYWNNQPFFAFGLGATSLVDRVRFARPRLLSQYRAYVHNLHQHAVTQSNSNHHLPLTTTAFPLAKVQTQFECLEDHLINRFRLLSDGVNFSHLSQLYGQLAERRLRDAVIECDYLLKQDLLQFGMHHTEGDFIHLTEKGVLIENSVVSDLLWHTIWKFADVVTPKTQKTKS